VLIPNESEKDRLVRTMLLDPPAPSPTPDARAIAAINPQTLRVDVENGSGIPGVARRVAELLRKQGFTIGDIGNAQNDTATTELHEHSKTTYAGLKVRQALGKAAQNVPVIADGQPATPAPGSDVTIIVGQDLAALITAQASAPQQ
jgi:hypothetical protein